MDFCPRSWISISWPLQKIVSVQVLKQADCALCKETCFKFRFWFSRSRAELWSKISPHLLHSPRWQENSNSSTCQKDLPGFCYLSEPPVSPSFLPVVHSPWNDQRVLVILWILSICGTSGPVGSNPAYCRQLYWRRQPPGGHLWRTLLGVGGHRWTPLVSTLVDSGH